MIDEKKIKNLKECTLKMYEDTIKQMKEKNLDTTEIEKEYEDTKRAYESSGNTEIKNCMSIPMPEALKKQQYVDYKGDTIELIGEHPDFSVLLMQNLFVVRFFDIPEYLIRNVFFDSEDTMRIGFYESNNFCVLGYLTTMKNKLKGTFSIEYLDKTGSLIRLDTYELKSIDKIKQFPLDYASNSPVYLEIELKHKNHGITTK